jgi:hypothetical protein
MYLPLTWRLPASGNPESADAGLVIYGAAGAAGSGWRPRSSRPCAPHAPVEADDLVARLVLGGPELGAVRGLVVPAGQRLGKRPAEDLAEVPELPDRQVLDQAEELVPVEVRGRRMSYSQSPSSFQTSASRTQRRWS